MSFLIALLFIAKSSDASPITTVGNHVERWPINASGPTVTYYIDSTVDDTLAGWSRNAATIWSSVSNSYIKLVETDSSSSANIIVFADLSRNGGTAEGMYADVAREGNTGNITFCSVHMPTQVDVNSEQTPGLTQYLRSSIIHEFGHCVGLQHSVMSNSIMSYRNGSPLSPGGDDVYAITLLYPVDGNSQYPMGCATTEREDGQGKPRSDGQDHRGVECIALFLALLLGTTLFREEDSWKRSALERYLDGAFLR